MAMLYYRNMDMCYCGYVYKIVHVLFSSCSCALELSALHNYNYSLTITVGKTLRNWLGERQKYP